MIESPAKRLDAEILGLAKARRKLLAKIAALLLEMKRGKHFQAFGCATLGDYAASRLEFSAWKTRDLVELAERSERLPRVRAAFESGETHGRSCGRSRAWRPSRRRENGSRGRRP